MRQMQSRRRQSVDYFSPANSTNQKNPFHHRYPAGCFSVTTQSQEDDIDYGFSGGKKSSDLLLMATYVGAAERHLGSSFGSCATWNTASIVNKCPTTPSPVCSPLSPLSPPSQLLASPVADDDDPSFATPNQSSCVISNGAGKESASPEEIQQESRKLASTTHVKKSTREGHGSSKNRCSGTTPTPGRKVNRYVRPVMGHFLCEAEDYFGTSSCGIDDNGDDGRLPAVREEQEEEKGCNHNHHLTMSSLYSDSNGEGGSAYENSDMESFIEERTTSAKQARRALSSNFAAETRRDTLAGTLTAWREARTMKLMDKLRKKEAVINQWEKEMATKAKMDMKETEMKLEKKRERELNTMQRRIRSAQKAAEKKRARERAATAKKIAKVTEAFEKTTATGKLPWLFLCL